MSGRPDRPETADVIRAWIELHEQDTHTCLVARVQSYDAAKQTADLVPVVRHAVEQPDGAPAYEELPVLPHVPVAFPRAGKWFVSLPLAAGDFVVVHVFDAAHEHWRAGSGELAYPGDLRRRSPGSCVAYPANFYPRGASLGHASGTDLVIGKDDGARFAIKPNGDFTFAGGSTPVAKEGSRTVGHTHAAGALTAGPYPVVGMTASATDTIAAGEGSQHVKVP